MVQSTGVSAVLRATSMHTVYILTQYSTPYAHSGVVTGKNCMKLLQYAREKQVRSCDEEIGREKLIECVLFAVRYSCMCLLWLLCAMPCSGSSILLHPSPQHGSLDAPL
jgi:hypothetical protein